MTTEQLKQALNDVVALAVKYSASNSQVGEVNTIVKNIYLVQQEIEKALTDGD